MGHLQLSSFFFNAGGDYIERSVPGMYRSLLLQLLQSVPEVQSVLENPDLNCQDLNDCLRLDHLKEILSCAVLALGKQPFTCFIDALDECDEQQVMDMIRFFEELATQTAEKQIKFRICLSSRHYPYIFVPESINLTLENQLGHTEDLAAFVDSRLRIPDSALSSQLRPDILQKASGVFLWVSLVVDILNDQYSRGGMDLRKRLRQIPDDLHDLFKDMLRRDKRNKESLLLCILWADEEPPNITRADGSNAADRFIIGSSKGLAEVTKTKEPRVQFIHESVRDFLLKSGGLKELWPDVGYDWEIQAHERLKECCSFYLGYHPVQTLARQILNSNIVISKDSTREQYPFLGYASQHILDHADVAEEAIPQQEFLSQFPIQPWIAISNLFQKHDIRRYKTTANFLYILADKGFPNLILRWLKDNPQTDIVNKAERFRYPLFAALANGNKSSVAALLDISTTIQDGVDITGGLSHIKDLKNFNGRKPLSWACQEGRGGIAILLLRNGASASEPDWEGCYPLLRALKSGQDAIAKILIEHGANVNCVEVAGDDYYTPILLASADATIQSLLEKGADPKFRMRDGSTILHYMSERGNETGIRAIISQVKGMIDIVNVTDQYGTTALVYACVYGHAAVVKLLLEFGADVNIGHLVEGDGTLMEAIKRGYSRIVRLCIQHNADLYTRSQHGETPVFLALRYGQVEIVQRLVDAGVDLLAARSSDPETWNPVRGSILFWASKFSHISIAERILGEDTDCSITSAAKDAALKVAKDEGHVTMAKILTSYGALEGAVRILVEMRHGHDR